STVRFGKVNGRKVGTRWACIMRGLAPCTVTKLGQKPLTQEKSLLQLDWSIWRLRPNSVSTGSTDRQLDWVLQSPQPSHTAWLMKTRWSGSGKVPRFRRRRVLGGE